MGADSIPKLTTSKTDAKGDGSLFTIVIEKKGDANAKLGIDVDHKERLKWATLSHRFRFPACEDSRKRCYSAVLLYV